MIPTVFTTRRQENGVLYITLPKKEEAMDKGPRAIDVK